jgi:hypothetical protein
MAQWKRKLAYAAFGGLIVMALQSSSGLIMDNAVAQSGKQAAVSANKVKYLFTVDYPLGKKGDYLNWVKSISATLQAPEEVKRMAAYDSYFGDAPHRVVEMEFEDMAAAAKYFEREKIRKIFEEWPGHGVNAGVRVLTLRGDFTKK